MPWSMPNATWASASDLDVECCVGPAGERVPGSGVSLCPGTGRAEEERRAPDGRSHSTGGGVRTRRREARSDARRRQGMRYRARYKDAAGRRSPGRSPRRRSRAALARRADRQMIRHLRRPQPRSGRRSASGARPGWPATRPAARSTVRQARVHVAQITAAFGSDAARGGAAVGGPLVDGEAQGRRPGRQLRLRAALPAVAGHERRRARRAAGAQPVLAAHLARGRASQRPYVATTEQVWALHDAVAEHLRPAILLGAFVGLRTAEVGRAAGRGRRLHARRRPAGAAGRRGAAEDARRPGRRCPIPQELALELVGGRGPVGRRPRRHRRRWAGRPRPGRSSGRSARPGRRSPGCPRRSASTTCGTTWRRCSSAAASTSRSSSTGSGTAQRQDDAGHLRPPVARQRRVRTGRRGCGAGGSCGLGAD